MSLLSPGTQESDANAPWAGDPVVAQPQSASPAPAAPNAATPDAPWMNDPAVQQPSGPAQVVNNTVDQGGFRDQQPAQAHQMPQAVKDQIVNILATHPIETAAQDARDYLSPLGYNAAPSNDPKYADNFDQVIAYRKATGIVGKSVENLLPPVPSNQSMTAGAAAVRGAGDSMSAGLLNKADAALHAIQDGLTGDSKTGFIDDFHRWEDVNQSILDADEANHPYARLTGQLLGGLAIPTGMEGVGLEAGKSVLVSGGTMREARAAAAAAVRNRLTAEGAVYGGVHGAANNTNDPVLGAIEGTATGAAGAAGLATATQTAPKVAKFIQDVTPDALVSTAPEEQPDYVQIARDLNIARTPATNSKTGVTTVMQSGLGALPGGQPIASAVNRETNDLATAARNVAEGVGPVSDRQGAGTAIAQGAQQYKADSRLEAKSLYGQRDALIGGSDTSVPTPNTKTALDNIAQRFPTSPAIQQLREHPAIRAIGGALPDEPTTEEVPTGILDADGNPITRTVTSGGQPLTLGEVTEALSHVRGVVRNLQSQTLNGKATAPILSRVQQVEQGLEDDVMDAAKNADIAAGREPGSIGSAVKAQQDADAFYADRSAALNGALKKPLQSANDDTQVSGEAVYNQIYGDMSAKSGNLARLRDTWFRLPDQAKRTFAATAIDDLGRSPSGAQNNEGNAWSFNAFLTNRDKLSPQARNIVFGAKADSQLDQIATYANRLRTLDKARNFSNTAQKYFAGAFMATVGGAVMHGDLGTAAEAAMALPATWGGAKLLLATPKMRDWTAQAMRVMSSNSANKEAALKVLTKKLGSIATADPTIASEATGLQQAITRAANDNLRSLAASGGQQQPQAQSGQSGTTRQ